MTAEGVIRITIPHQAVGISSAAVEAKGEFDAVGTLTFPYLKHSEPLFGGDFHAPSSWMAHIRVFGDESVRVPQLYVQVSNREEHGFVRYDTAALSGGNAARVEHISYRQVDNPLSSGSFWYEEHLGIALTPKLLAEYIDKPLRIQVSRPDENIRFIVEVPAHYVAGVLHRLDPDKYEVEAAPTQRNSASNSSSQPDLAWIKKAGWIAGAGGFVGLFFGGLTSALSFAFIAFMIAAVIFHKSEKS